MRKTETGLSLSATDLSNSVACRQLTGLDMSVALEGRDRPFRNDPLGDILRERGLAHEKSYVDHLKSQGRRVLDLSAIKDPADAAAATLEAMRVGQDVIVQGALLSDDGRWYGRPDVLLRTEKRGTWAWTYEAVDTKLAQETRGGTVLQLSFYSDLLSVARAPRPSTSTSSPRGAAPRARPIAPPTTPPGSAPCAPASKTPRRKPPPRSSRRATPNPSSTAKCASGTKTATRSVARTITSRWWRTRPAARGASWKQTASPRSKAWPDAEVLDERQALSGLEFIKDLGFVPSAKTGKPTSFVIHRYHYPGQEMEIRAKDELKTRDGKSFGRWSPSIANDEPSTSARAS